MKMSRNNGITLIALVITIIVMLILVAITINMTINGGLFNYANKASEGTKEAMTEERIKLSVYSAYIEGNGTLNYEKLISALQKEFEEGNYEITPNDRNAESWTITVGKAEVEVENGEYYISPEEKEIIEKLNLATSKALANSEDNVINDIQSEITEYDENALIWDFRDAEPLKETKPNLYMKNNKYKSIAYVNNNYYVLKKNENEWKKSNETVFDLYMKVGSDVTWEGRNHQDIIRILECDLSNY